MLLMNQNSCFSIDCCPIFMGARSGGATPYEAFGGWLYWLLERIWRLTLPFTQKRWNKKTALIGGGFLSPSDY